MNEDLYGMFDKVLQSEYSIIEDGPKKTIELEKVQNTVQCKPTHCLME